MKVPRFLHHWCANLLGYFWLPCPLCREYFGGHESSGNYLMTSYTDGWAVCPNCEEVAKEYNKQWCEKILW